MFARALAGKGRHSSTLMLCALARPAPNAGNYCRTSSGDDAPGTKRGHGRLILTKFVDGDKASLLVCWDDLGGLLHVAMCLVVDGCGARHLSFKCEPSTGTISHQVSAEHRTGKCDLLSSKRSAVRCREVARACLMQAFPSQWRVAAAGHRRLPLGCCEGHQAAKGGLLQGMCMRACMRVLNCVLCRAGKRC